MLTLRRETDYAVQLLKRLRTVKKGECVSLHTVAEETGFSFLFLQKIARKLRQSGLIIARQGVEGGYELGIPAKKITLQRIIESTEGGCQLCPCLPTDHCPITKKKKCKTSAQMSKLNKKIVKVFSAVKLTEL